MFVDLDLCDFIFSSGCGHCKAMKPAYGEAARKLKLGGVSVFTTQLIPKFDNLIIPVLPSFHKSMMLQSKITIFLFLACFGSHFLATVIFR